MNPNEASSKLVDVSQRDDGPECVRVILGVRVHETRLSARD